jgi:hypothetical protein
MNSSNSALMNRLILLVLCLNLVCLVLLVVRSYQNAGRERSVSLRGPPPDQNWEQPVSAADTFPAGTAVRTPVKGVPARTATPPTGAAAVRPAEAMAAKPEAGRVENIEQAVAPAPLVNLPSRSGHRQETAKTGGRPLSALRGMVTLRGTPTPEIPIQMGPECGRLGEGRGQVTTRHYVVNEDGGLANVLVWLKNAAAARASSDAEPALLDQVSCMFEPYVLGVVTGQQLRIRNSDPVLHNLHATPRLNPEFNFAQSAGAKVMSISFRKPELAVRIKCDVHPWMFAYVHVLDHPFFAITDTNGLYRIPAGVPDGRYVVAASHLKAGTYGQEIELLQGVERELHFELTVPTPAQAQAH